jgi:hypothetical protein
MGTGRSLFPFFLFKFGGGESSEDEGASAAAATNKSKVNNQSL